jgi:hypothetical protein
VWSFRFLSVFLLVRFENFHHFIAEMIDHFYGDATGGGFVKWS